MQIENEKDSVYSSGKMEQEDEKDDESENDESEEDTQRLKHRVMCLEKQITSLAALILDNTTSKKNLTELILFTNYVD